MKRKIIHIDEALCNGCGLCIPDCPEGAIRLVDGKARLAGESLCDGLGACLGRCPQGAITVEEREAEAYDEGKVMANVAARGEETVRSHLRHLKEHGEHGLLRQALDWLGAGAAAAAPGTGVHTETPCGCPGSRSISLASPAETPAAGAVPSSELRAASSLQGELTHWPVQLHLISPRAPHFQGADLVLAADCVAYALGDFHRRFLKGRTLAIACPKLDEGQEIYAQKLQALIEEAGINTLTVVIMEVPCCGGLLRLAQAALARSSRKVPLKAVVVGVRGEVQREEWI